MLDEDLVDELVASADVVMHLASAVGVQLVVDRPLDSLIRNVRGNDIVISAAARHGRRLLFTSTSEVYGKNSSDALSEDSDRILGSPYKSRWAYATAKAFGEALDLRLPPRAAARRWWSSGSSTPSARASAGAYGMVLPRFVRQALAGEELTVYGTGTQSRCFVHVHDSVHAMLMLCDAELANGRVFNVGSAQRDHDHRARRQGDRADRLALGDQAGALRRGLRRGLRGARQAQARHRGAARSSRAGSPPATSTRSIDDVIAYERSGASEPGGVSVA